MSTLPHPVVVFDGECLVCNGWADFLMRFDRKDLFRFAALQSEAGSSLARRVTIPLSEAGSIVLVEGEQALVRSTAVLRMLALLGFPFALAAVFLIVPVGWRDALYDFVARNRFKWFGRRETCRLPSPEERKKFL